MPSRHIHTALSGLLVLGATLFGAAPVSAQEAWPTKPVRIVSPFPAGGTSDVMARLVADALSKELGQQFIVDNVAGAGGTISMIGTARTAKLPPDGYTLISAEIKQRLEVIGVVVPPPGAARYTEFVKSEIAFWTHVIQTGGIKAE